jgi:hypothetical protein
LKVSLMRYYRKNSDISIAMFIVEKCTLVEYTSNIQSY